MVLLLAVILSALYLVRTQYESRRLFVELDKANAQARALDVERERLEVDKRGQATPLRVEKLARDSLRMHGVNPALTDYVAYQGTVASAVTPGRQASSGAGARP